MLAYLSARARFRFNQCSPPSTGSSLLKYATRAANIFSGGTTHNIVGFCHIQLYNQRRLISTKGIKAHGFAIKRGSSGFCVVEGYT
jgi:hypothetical protein